jgi:hypothetical protein
MMLKNMKEKDLLSKDVCSHFKYFKHDSNRITREKNQQQQQILLRILTYRTTKCANLLPSRQYDSLWSSLIEFNRGPCQIEINLILFATMP